MDEEYMQQGVFSWSELMTTDPDAAKAFYSKLFGWTTEDVRMDGVTYTVLKAGDREIGGIMAIPADVEGAPPNWGTYVSVDDADATARTAAQLGGKILVAPRDIPDVGRFCVIQDPQGALISAITYVRPEATE